MLSCEIQRFSVFAPYRADPLSAHSEQNLPPESPTKPADLLLTLALAAHVGRQANEKLAVERFLRDHNVTMEEFDAAARRSRKDLPSASPRLIKLVRLLPLTKTIAF